MDSAGAQTPLTEPQPQLTINHPALNPPCSSSSQLEWSTCYSISMWQWQSLMRLACELVRASLQVTQWPSHRTLHLKRAFPVCLLEQVTAETELKSLLSLLSLIFRISRSKLLTSGLWQKKSVHVRSRHLLLHSSSQLQRIQTHWRHRCMKTYIYVWDETF